MVLKEYVGARQAIIDSDVLIEIIERNIAEKLSVFFSVIYVPMAVKKEQKKRRRRYNLRRLFDSGLFKRCRVLDESRVQLLQMGSPKLQPGESEAIIQAQEQNINVLLTNERKAMKVAARLGLVTVTFQELEQKLQELRILRE